jgi:DNA-binding transcriptional MerR regulator
MTSVNPLPVLQEIPAKRYFTIGEVSDLCDVKTHVLRYWEQEFSQLKPVKRRGNRRYYQRQDVLLIRAIRDLLYSQGFTIQGAKQQLQSFKVSELPSSVAARAVTPSTTIQSVDNDQLIQEALSEMIDDLEAIAQMLSR